MSTLLKGMQQLGRPIVFYPGLCKLFGIKAALFLGQLMYWTPKTNNPDGWIYKSVDQLEKETMLSYKEQMKVREILVQAGVLEEHYARTQHLMFFRINAEALESKLYSLDSAPTEMDDSPESEEAPAPGAPTTCSGSTNHLLREHQPPAPMADRIKTESTTESTERDYRQRAVGGAPQWQAGKTQPVPLAGNIKSGPDERVGAAVRHYKSRMKEHGLTADVREKDKHAVHRFFVRTKVFPKQFCRVLDHAFASDKQYPLHSGFSLADFVAHYSAYERGPIQGNGNGGSYANERSQEPALTKLRDPRTGGVIDVLTGEESSWLRDGYELVG